MSKEVQHVMSAIDFIERNLSEKLDLDVISEAVHYSKYHLHRMFTGTVGVTIHDYIQRRKLTEAAKLLVFSDKPILEISLIAGYESQQAFTTIFREMYKKTPQQYRTGKEFYPLQLRYVLSDRPKLPGKALDWTAAIRPASFEDIPLWMDLVYLVVDGFPHFKEEEYRDSLLRSIRDGEAFLIEDRKMVVGAMMIRSQTGSIDFLAVHPQYRRNGIARAFLRRATREFLPDTPISITTFRSGDKADPGYRNAWKSLGFTQAELLTEFGYPTQRFYLTDREAMVNHV